MEYFISIALGVVVGIAISYFIYKNNKAKAEKIIK